MQGAEATKKTDAEVEAAYKVARKIAISFQRLTRSQERTPSLDFEDLVQEGILGWLEGKDMYYAMLDAFKKAVRGSKYAYSVKGITQQPEEIPFDETLADALTEESPDLEKTLDAQAVLDRLLKIENEQAQFAMIAYIYFDMSLREIGRIFEKSHEWVRKYLINPELKKIREEFVK